MITSCVLFWTAATLGWLAIAYVAVSFIEFLAHGVFMHKPTWLSGKFSFFKKVLDLHRRFHHGECFPGRHFDEAEGDCLEINIRLGILDGLAMSCWIWAPMLAGAFFLGMHSLPGQLLALGGAVFIFSIVAHHHAWNMIHKQMHTKPEARATWFKNSSICLWLARYHFLHHNYPRVNFCIVCPGADWVMGTYKKPEAKDLQEMQKHGLLHSS